MIIGDEGLGQINFGFFYGCSLLPINEGRLGEGVYVPLFPVKFPLVPLFPWEKPHVPQSFVGIFLQLCSQCENCPYFVRSSKEAEERKNVKKTMLAFNNTVKNNY